MTGTWLMSHAAATKAFIPGGGGKILSVTLSPHNGMPGMVHSGAARAAVENMMRTLAIEWSRFGITTCAIAAGQFATETMLTKYPPEIIERVKAIRAICDRHAVPLPAASTSRSVPPRR